MRKELGMLVRERRKELGLTQGQLGAKLGVSAQAVSNWERDAEPIPVSRYEDLATALSLPLDELKGGLRFVRPSELGQWRDLVFDETSIHPHAQLILLWLSRLADEVNGEIRYIGSLARVAGVVRSLDDAQVEAAWDAVLHSQYVDKTSDAEWDLKLTFPREH